MRIDVCMHACLQDVVKLSIENRQLKAELDATDERLGHMKGLEEDKARLEGEKAALQTKVLIMAYMQGSR
jgi:hypothetical protein